MAVAIAGPVDVLEHDNVTVSIEFITPTMAEQMLRLNTANRKRRKTRLAQYARAMSLGLFGLSDQGISFDESGTLTNGQHRLEACVLAGAGFWSIVVRGLTEGDKVNVDTGLARSLSDVLAWRGEDQAPDLAALIRFCWKYDRENLHLADSPPLPEALDYLVHHPRLRDSIVPARRACTKTRITKTALGAIHYLTSRDGCASTTGSARPDADEFLQLLSSGEGLFDGSPIYALRRYADQNLKKTNHAHSRPHPYTQAALTMKAINAWRKGDSMKVIAWKRGGAAAESFPKVWVDPSA